MPQLPEYGHRDEEQLIDWEAKEVRPDRRVLNSVREKGHDPRDQRVASEVNVCEMRLQLWFEEVQKSLQYQAWVREGELLAVIEEATEVPAVDLPEDRRYEVVMAIEVAVEQGGNRVHALDVADLVLMSG